MLKTKSFVHKLLNNSSFVFYKAKKHLNWIDLQNLKSKTRAHKLYGEVLTGHEGWLILDDETYVKYDFKQLLGQNNCVFKTCGSVFSKKKYILHDKYAKRQMIWQGIWSCGMKSKKIVTLRTLNSNFYIKKCLRQQFPLFIRTHNSPVRF
jgi:hypothetical protein